jgi:ferritin heavy chain
MYDVTSESQVRPVPAIMMTNMVILLRQQKPPRDEWGSPLEAMEEALKLEKKVNAALLELHSISSDRNDPQVSCILSTFML